MRCPSRLNFGSTAFPVYVNGLPQCVTNSQIKLHAVDTVIYNADANIENVYVRTQESLDDFVCGIYKISSQ